MEDDSLTCEKCEERIADVTCSCGSKFCEHCFKEKHLVRNPKHKKGGTKKSQEYWNWVTGKFGDLTGNASQPAVFKQDEAAKWFGLHTEYMASPRAPGTTRITTLVETDRLCDLMERSIVFHADSPKRQYPSIASFVGDTGAGKSTLVRSLMFHSGKAADIPSLESPVPGAQSGSSAILSTTGEVNLYLDPASFGTETPTLFADCEGMLGTEPVASQHQTDWVRSGRSYLVTTKDKKPMDRRTAVKTLYPRFLYVFSDVVCYVTRNHRAWADSSVRLLEWSMAGAQGTINQHSLPALIIVLNGPAIENEEWIQDDQAATRDFFRAIQDEISANVKLGEFAKRHGDSSMEELFARSFSSVHVHYVPLEGYQSLGTVETICQQTTRLAQRIRAESERVQGERAKAWTRFNSKDLSLVVEYAFKHFASGSTGPFDFGECRQQLSVPDSTEKNFSEFLGGCLKTDAEKRFDATASALACGILRASLRSQEKDYVVHPTTVWTHEIQAVCERAVGHFLDNNMVCRYVDAEENERCVNTKVGHALGHQGSSGQLLANGLFIGGEFDCKRFLDKVEDTIRVYMATINSLNAGSRIEWRRHAAEMHRTDIARLRSLKAYPHLDNNSDLSLAAKSTCVCYGCFFDRPEYLLPCGHTLCIGCLFDFDQTPLDQQYPGFFAHDACIICAENRGLSWPFTVKARPDLAGVRVLSLDGGGVRGVLQLVVLRRLEALVNIGIPIGKMFDMMVGTSAGGIIGLGLGIQGRSTTECITLFKQFCRQGFKHKKATKTKFIGLVARYFRKSIYKTEPLESALSSIFSPAGGERKVDQVYGLSNHTRVAVTTTACKDTRLIANYNRGGDGRYLKSELRLWQAARYTSAAPMYFEEAYHDGDVCRDGGLKENNPVQLTVTECKKTWGEAIKFDALLSVGSGKARKSQEKPSFTPGLPEWLKDLFTTLLSTLDGEEEWKRFYDSLETRIRDRACRLNVALTNMEHEPALDDTSQITLLEELATAHKFPALSISSKFSPFPHDVTDDAITTLAHRLRASMYFFQLSSIEKSMTSHVYAVKGWIGCRLMPGEAGFTRLLDLTTDFIVMGQSFGKPDSSIDVPMRHEVNFQQQTMDDPIRIDVLFWPNNHATISGFPMTMQELKNYWDVHSEELRQQQIRQLPELSDSNDPTPIHELATPIHDVPMPHDPVDDAKLVLLSAEPTIIVEIE